MSITPGYTNEQIREIVYAYDRQPYGTKIRWRDERGLTDYWIRRWRRAVYDGDLDRGLVPRETTGMPSSQPRRRANAESQDPKARRIAELEQRIDQLEKTNDALGKAIGLLHDTAVTEPDDDPEQANPSTS